MLDTKLPIWMEKIKRIPFLSRIVYQGHIIQLLLSNRSPVCEKLYQSIISIPDKQFFKLSVTDDLLDLVHYFCFSSWYSFSVLTFQIADLSVLPLFIAFTASKDVTIEWSMLL